MAARDGNGGYDELIESLQGLAGQLSDTALDLLRSAARAAEDGERTALQAEEKRVTRARRSVDKAVALLRGRTDVF